MARPRTPTKVLKMRGSFVKHPERAKAREHEPQVTQPLGEPPENLDEAERARWADIRGWCPWLGECDRALVEQTCRLWMRERRGEAKPAEMKLFQSNLSRLGMTPVDRSKVQMAKRDDDDKTALLA